MSRGGRLRRDGGPMRKIYAAAVVVGVLCSSCSAHGRDGGGTDPRAAADRAVTTTTARSTTTDSPGTSTTSGSTTTTPPTSRTTEPAETTTPAKATPELRAWLDDNREALRAWTSPMDALNSALEANDFAQAAKPCVALGIWAEVSKDEPPAPDLATDALWRKVVQASSEVTEACLAQVHAPVPDLTDLKEAWGTAVIVADSYLKFVETLDH